MIDLFQRNFDLDARQAVHGDALAEAEAIADLKAQLDAARQEGFDAGRRIGRQDAEAEFTAAESGRMAAERDAIRAQIDALTAQDARARQEAERDITELFLGMADRLVPELLDTYGLDLALGRIRQAVQSSRTDPVLVIRACPDVIAVLETEAPGWLSAASQSTQIELEPDPEMNRGAAQVRWKGGRMDYDLAAAAEAMRKALAEAARKYEQTSQKAG